MKKIGISHYSFLLAAIVAGLTLNTGSAHAQRLIGAHGFVIDDGSGNTITILTPPSGWHGNISFQIPIPPAPGASAGFVMPGTGLNQSLTWVPAPAGGPAGSWQPVAIGAITGISGSGTAGTIPIWLTASTQGNSKLTDDGTTLSYSGAHINSATDYQIGGSTVLSDGGTLNLFVGVGAGASNTGQYNTFSGDAAGSSNTTGLDNTFLGFQAGTANTTGNWNTFLGVWSGLNNTTASANTFIGVWSGLTNTTGADNTFLGYLTGEYNSTGGENTFVGTLAGEANTTGWGSAFFGSRSGYSTTTGIHNSFFGDSSGFSNTTGNYNTFSGAKAGSSNTTGDYNTFSGDAAGSSNTTGLDNTFLGFQAGTANTTGNWNTFLGVWSGLNNTTASANTFIGVWSGLTNTTGADNTFLGYLTGEYNSTGGENTFVGTLAGEANTTGWGSAFFGSRSGYSTTTGIHNSFFGDSSGFSNTTGNYNTFSGAKAGSSNTTGDYNTFSGDAAGSSNTTGLDNTFLGFQAGTANTTGNWNTFLGVWSGLNNTTASANTFIGVWSGLTNTTGADNTFLGYLTGEYNSTGGENTFVGTLAGEANTTGWGSAFFGSRSGYSTTTGIHNSFFGDSSGLSNTTGANNTALGYNTNVGSALTNTTAIGAGATVTASNTIQLGNASVTAVNTSGAINSSMGYQVSGAAISGNYLRGNGTNFVSSAIQASDLPSGSGSYIQNQNAGAQTSASFWISGSGTAGGSFNTTGGAYQIGGSTVLSDAGTLNLFVGVGAGASNTANFNAFSGGLAGYANTTGSDNTFTGTYAGYTNTTGAENTISGRSAGQKNTTGGFNTFTGVDAGFSNTTAGSNTFTGYNAGVSNTTGTQNTFSGLQAGQSNVTGSNLTVLGNDADVRVDGLNNATAIGAGATVTASNTIQLGNASVTLVNTSGAINSSMGYQVSGAAISGNYLRGNGTDFVSSTIQASDLPASSGNYIQNQNVGAQTSASFWISGSGTAGGNFNTTGGSYQIGGTTVLSDAGTQNLFVGTGTGAGNTGGGNAFLGFLAGNANTTGSYNMFSGSYAGYANTTGVGNTFSGFDAGYSNTTGLDNTFSGVNAGYSNTTGYNNTFSGWQAGYSNMTGFDNTFSGLYAGYSNTAGPYNTFSGFEAGQSNTTGYSNTVLGYGADVGSGALTNATALGAGAIVSASNTIQLGNGNVTLVNTSGAINSSMGYQVSGAAISGNYLRGNGTDFVSSAIQASDLPSGSGSYIQNQFAGPQSASFDINGSVRILGSTEINSNDLLNHSTHIGNGVGTVLINSATWSVNNGGVVSAGGFDADPSGTIQTGGPVDAGTLFVTTGTSGIQLGLTSNATTLSSTATSARAISFPDKSGTIALLSDIANAGVAFDVNTAQTSSTVGNYVYDVTSKPPSGNNALGALITSVGQGSGDNATALTITATAGATSGLATGLSFNVTGAANNDDIRGTNVNWDVQSNGWGEFTRLSASSSGSSIPILNVTNGTSDQINTGAAITVNGAIGTITNVGLIMDVQNGTNNYDIEGTGYVFGVSPGTWSVTSAGAATFAGLTDVGTTDIEGAATINTTNALSTTIGNSTGGTSITGKKWSVNDATGNIATTGTLSTTSDVSVGRNLIQQSENVDVSGGATTLDGLANIYELNTAAASTIVSMPATTTGQVVYVHNSTGNSQTISGAVVANGQSVTVVYFPTSGWAVTGVY